MRSISEHVQLSAVWKSFYQNWFSFDANSTINLSAYRCEQTVQGRTHFGDESFFTDRFRLPTMRAFEIGVSIRCLIWCNNVNVHFGWALNIALFVTNKFAWNSKCTLWKLDENSMANIAFAAMFQFQLLNKYIALYI